MATWILVSDVSRAVLFSAEKRDDDWSLVTHFEHPEGRELSSEIRPSSPPGRMQKNKASGARSSMEPHTWPKEADAERFAKVLASYLDEGAAKGQFTDLVLVASPHFLGMVHNTLGKQTAKHLRATVHHDLVMLDGAEIRRRCWTTSFRPHRRLKRSTEVEVWTLRNACDDGGFAPRCDGAGQDRGRSK